MVTKFTSLSTRPVVVAEEVHMSTITITLPEDRLVKLKEMAARLGVTPEDLARVSIAELLSRPEDTVQRAITYVLTKNAELYRRLA
jgi:antitoxin FitA